MIKKLVIFCLFFAGNLYAGNMPSRYQGATHIYRVDDTTNTIRNVITGVIETPTDTEKKMYMLESRYGKGLAFNHPTNTTNDLYFRATGVTLSKTTGWTIGIYFKLLPGSGTQLLMMLDNYFTTAGTSRIRLDYQCNAAGAYAANSNRVVIYNKVPGTVDAFGQTGLNSDMDYRYHLYFLEYNPATTTYSLYYDNNKLLCSFVQAQYADMVLLQYGYQWVSHMMDESFIINRPLSAGEKKNIWAWYNGWDMPNE